MRICLQILFLAQLASTIVNAQSYVTIIYDAKHLAIVGENGAVRSTAETAHNMYLNTINERLNDININVSSVVLVQNIIHNTLTHVDRALRNGLTVKQIASIGNEIIKECNSVISFAKSEPHFLLFAEDISVQIKNRSLRLASEVSEFVLREGENVLMDYAKRDALLNKIVLELKVIRALIYSIHRSMYYTKLKGIIPTINPYRNYIDRDKQLVNDIIINYKILKD